MFELPIFDCAYFTIRHGIKYQEIMETVHGIANRQQISTFGLECCYVFQGIKAVYARYQGQFKTSFSCYIYLIVNFTKCRGRGRLALAVNFSILQKESDKQAGNRGCIFYTNCNDQSLRVYCIIGSLHPDPIHPQ